MEDSATMCSMVNRRSFVFPLCTSLPLRRRLRRTACGSGSWSRGTIHGPTGALVSKAFAMVLWTPLMVTSLRTV